MYRKFLYEIEETNGVEDKPEIFEVIKSEGLEFLCFYFLNVFSFRKKYENYDTKYF